MHAGDANLLHFAVTYQYRIGRAGIRQGKPALACVVHREGHGDEACVEARAVQALVQQTEHCRWRAGMLDDVLAPGADGERAEKGGGGGRAGDGPEREREAAVSVWTKNLEIAGQ